MASYIFDGADGRMLVDGISMDGTDSWSKSLVSDDTR